MPGSDSNTFHQSIFTGIGLEPVDVMGFPATYYASVQHHLDIMAHPNAYASYVGIAAAQINNMFINVTLSNSPLPLPPQVGQPDTCYVFYNAAPKHYTTLRRCRIINPMHFPTLTTPNHSTHDNSPLRGVGCAPPDDANYHASPRHASLRRPVGNTPLPEGEPCMYTYNCQLFISSGTFLRARTFVRNVG